MAESDGDAGCRRASEASSQDSGSAPLRRSTRVRSRASRPCEIPDTAPSSPSAADGRLEQIAYSSVADLGLPLTDPAAGLRVLIHPVAAMLMSVHSHLTRTEVIGYLGGTVHTPDDAPGETYVVVVEAFAARALGARVLAKTGRSAYMEVEIDPESSVEVMACIHAKGLEVVGWYHSHPDECFTVEPSRVDIENQHNYQKHLFKEKPFVAAIIAPYNSDLPDHSPALEFFRVVSGEIPLRLPHKVDELAAVPSAALPEYWPHERSALRRYPLPALAEECAMLVDEHRRSAKRVRLGRPWREDVSCAEKLRGFLLVLADVCGPPGGNAARGIGEPLFPQSQADLFRDCVNRVVDHAARSFALAAEEEAEERAARKRRAAAQRAKRSRRR